MQLPRRAIALTRCAVRSVPTTATAVLDTNFKATHPTTHRVGPYHMSCDVCTTATIIIDHTGPIRKKYYLRTVDDLADHVDER